MTREDAIKSLRNDYCGNKAFCELYRVSLCRTTDCEIYHALTALEAEPTKRGQWVIVDGKVVCSECYEPNVETNYCPNCGARMDLDEVEECLKHID